MKKANKKINTGLEDSSAATDQINSAKRSKSFSQHSSNFQSKIYERVCETIAGGGGCIGKKGNAGKRGRIDGIKRAGGAYSKKLADAHTPVLLMISGGSDSTALAYLGAQLCTQHVIGQVAALHVNHKIRGQAADADQAFVERLCALLGIPLYVEQIDIPQIVEATGENMEAVARRERYRVANEALHTLCKHAREPYAEGRIFTAHTQDDRVENFYMRSIVGTGPGGFRSMRYLNGNVARPCLDVSRQDLRDYLLDLEQSGAKMARTGINDACTSGSVERADSLGQDEASSIFGQDEMSGVFGQGATLDTADQNGALWCEDATNAHTDMFRAFVRHKIVPVARERNTSLLTTLTRTMNLIADEDDYMDSVAQDTMNECVEWMGECDVERASKQVHAGVDANDARDNRTTQCEQPATRSCKIAPVFGNVALPVQRRVILKVLQEMLGTNVRVESASVQAVLDAFGEDEVCVENSAYVENSVCAESNASAKNNAYDKNEVPDESNVCVDSALADPAITVSDLATTIIDSSTTTATTVATGDTASVMADAAADCIKRKPKSGYSTNIQGNLAVSANKRGVLIELMSEYRKRRGRI